jgi:hypothetical protein
MPTLFSCIYKNEIWILHVFVKPEVLSRLELNLLNLVALIYCLLIPFYGAIHTCIFMFWHTRFLYGLPFPGSLIIFRLRHVPSLLSFYSISQYLVGV